MRYRRITTTGQIREKKKERRQNIYVWLIVIVILAILVGVGYLATPSTVLLQQTAFRGISYRPLMAFVMLFTAILVIVIGILLADKYTKFGYYLKTIACGIVIGMLFHGMGINLLLNMNRWLASKTPVRKEYRVTEIRFLKPNKLARYRTILPECRILKAVGQDNPDDCLYFHVPIDTQVAMGCVLHVTIKNGFFGWKSVDELAVDCRELHKYVK
mgnify:FL=1